MHLRVEIQRSAMVSILKHYLTDASLERDPWQALVDSVWRVCLAHEVDGSWQTYEDVQAMTSRELVQSGRPHMPSGARRDDQEAFGQQPPEPSIHILAIASPRRDVLDDLLVSVHCIILTTSMANMDGLIQEPVLIPVDLLHTVSIQDVELAVRYELSSYPSDKRFQWKLYLAQDDNGRWLKYEAVRRNDSSQIESEHRTALDPLRNTISAGSELGYVESFIHSINHSFNSFSPSCLFYSHSYQCNSFLRRFQKHKTFHRTAVIVRSSHPRSQLFHTDAVAIGTADAVMVTLSSWRWACSWLWSWSSLPSLALRKVADSTSRSMASSADWLAASAVLMSACSTPRVRSVLLYASCNGESSSCTRSVATSRVPLITGTHWSHMRPTRSCFSGIAHAPNTVGYRRCLLLTRTLRMSLAASSTSTSKFSSHTAGSSVFSGCGMLLVRKTRCVSVSSPASAALPTASSFPAAVVFFLEQNSPRWLPWVMAVSPTYSLQ